jgi:hypothetical protein
VEDDEGEGVSELRTVHLSANQVGDAIATYLGQHRLAKIGERVRIILQDMQIEMTLALDSFEEKTPKP